MIKDVEIAWFKDEKCTTTTTAPLSMQAYRPATVDLMVGSAQVSIEVVLGYKESGSVTKTMTYSYSGSLSVMVPSNR